MSRPIAPHAAAADAPGPRWWPAATAIVSAAVTANGVLLYGWPVFVVMLLFWVENLLVGLANVVRIVVAGVRAGGAGVAAAVFVAAFFTLHYGIFTACHGLFVLAFFGPDGAIDEAMNRPVAAVSLLARTLGEPWVVLGLAVIALSVAMDTLRWLAATRADATPEAPQSLMAAPYGRMAVLHVTLILGGGLIAALQAPAAAAVLLVALKLGYDLLRLRRGDGLGVFERKPAAPAR